MCDQVAFQYERGIGIPAVPSLPKAVKRVRLPYPASSVDRFALRQDAAGRFGLLSRELSKSGLTEQSIGQAGKSVK